MEQGRAVNGVVLPLVVDAVQTPVLPLDSENKAADKGYDKTYV